MSKWDRFFMTAAETSANMSKDPKTQVGAVISKNKIIKSTGYNGAPRNFPDDLVPWNSIDSNELIDQKNTYMCHAELNAILNYDGKLSDLKDAVLYTTISPCSRCACMIAQVGIKKVIYKEKYHRKNETDAADRIFNLCNIKQVEYHTVDNLEETNNDS